MRVLRHLVLAAAAAFTGEQHLVRTTVRRRGTFRDAQHELMDGGAAIELAGDALLADAQRMDFLAANLAIRQPRGVAGVAIKNAGRAIADAGAKFRHKGGLELAAYAVDEAGVYFGDTECAKSLGRLEAPGAARAARAAGREAGETGENRFRVARAERRLGQGLRLAGRAPSRLRRRRAPRLPGPRGHRRPRRGRRVTGQGAPPRRHAVRAHPRRPAHDDVLRAFLRVPGGFPAAPIVPIRPSSSKTEIRF